MPKRIDFLCLANSYKHGGRCVAGLDLATGDWIRPVSSLEQGQLQRHHYITKDGYDPDPMDILRIHLTEHSPEPHQPENWHISNEHWEYIKSGATERVAQIIHENIHNSSELFGNEKSAVDYTAIKQSGIHSSLALVHPEQPLFYLDEREEKKSQPRVKFNKKETEYDLPITDPEWREKIRSEEILGDLNYDYEPASAYIDEQKDLLLTVSLGMPVDDVCYKLVAGIVPIPSGILND